MFGGNVAGPLYLPLASSGGFGHEGHAGYGYSPLVSVSAVPIVSSFSARGLFHPIACLYSTNIIYHLTSEKAHFHRCRLSRNPDASAVFPPTASRNVRVSANPSPLRDPCPANESSPPQCLKGPGLSHPTGHASPALQERPGRFGRPSHPPPLAAPGSRPTGRPGLGPPAGR